MTNSMHITFIFIARQGQYTGGHSQIDKNQYTIRLLMNCNQFYVYIFPGENLICSFYHAHSVKIDCIII